MQHKISLLEYDLMLSETMQLTVSYEPKESCTVVMDKRLLHSLVDNLISNAIKYNHTKGTIKIIVTASTLTIENSGRKMHKSEYAQLFHRYERGESSEGGFGLGLHIVAKIVEHYGFNIAMTPLHPSGTQVTLGFSA